MAWRRIGVGATRYTWICGTKFVVIKDASGKQIIKKECHEVRGITPEEWAKAQEQGTKEGMIVTGDIRKLIDQHLASP